MFKAVFFDYDGVIVDTMSYHVRAWQTQFDHYGIEISPYDVLLREGSMAIHIGRQIFQQYGVDISEPELRAFVAAKDETYRAITEAGILDGVVEFIDFLNTQSVKIGLVTGSSIPNIKRVISDELFGQFQTVVTRERVIHGKPHPEPYLLAAGALDLQPIDCLVVENAPMGIQSGKSAGMTVVALLTTLERHQIAGADFYFQEIVDLHKNWSTLINNKV